MAETIDRQTVFPMLTKANCSLYDFISSSQVIQRSLFTQMVVGLPHQVTVLSHLEDLSLCIGTWKSSGVLPCAIQHSMLGNNPLREQNI